MAESKQEMPIEDELKLSVIDLLGEQQQLDEQEHELINLNPKFAKYLQERQAFKTKEALIWKTIEDGMINNGIKSIKGEFGSLTIAEKTNFKATELELVPPRFIKKELDKSKVSAQFKLSGKLPKGVESSKTFYLTKRIKLQKPVTEE